jgi:hypothetical protein
MSACRGACACLVTLLAGQGTTNSTAHASQHIHGRCATQRRASKRRRRRRQRLRRGRTPPQNGCQSLPIRAWRWLPRVTPSSLRGDRQNKTGALQTQDATIWKPVRIRQQPGAPSLRQAAASGGGRQCGKIPQLHACRDTQHPEAHEAGGRYSTHTGATGTQQPLWPTGRLQACARPKTPALANQMAVMQ